MDKTELSKIIDANISKIYKKYQDANQIETGDISPEDDLKLAVIKKSLANTVFNRATDMSKEFFIMGATVEMSLYIWLLKT